MAEIDGLDIAPGRDQGEAVILPETTFDPVQFSRNAINTEMALRTKRSAERQKGYAEVKKWMDEKEPTQKWDTDKINYFQGKFDELRNKQTEMVKKYQGAPPESEMYTMNREWDKLKQEADLSNAQYDLFTKALTESQKKGEDNKFLYDASAQKAVNFYGDPKRFRDQKIVNGEGEETTVGAELEKAGGDVFKFREANKHLLHLSPAWDYIDKTEQYLGEGKVTAPTSIVEMARGGRKGTAQVKDYTDSQVDQLAESLYGNNPVQFQSQVIRDLPKYVNEKDMERFELQAAVNYGLIDAKGNETERVKNLSPEQKKALFDQAVAKEGYKRIFRNLHPKTEQGFNEFNKIPTNGAGKDNEKILIPTQYNNIAQGVRAEIQKTPNMPSAQQAQMLADNVNGKVIELAGGKHAVELPNPIGTQPFVMVPKSDILTKKSGMFGQSGPYAPNNAKSTGQIAGTKKQIIMQYKNSKGVTTTASDPDSKLYIQVIMDPVKIDTNNESEVEKSYAQFLITNPNTSVSKEAYKQMLENAQDVKGDFKIEFDAADPVAQSYMSQSVFGGNTVSNTQFNIARKSQNSKPAAKPSASNPSAKRKPLGSFIKK